MRSDIKGQKYTGQVCKKLSAWLYSTPKSTRVRQLPIQPLSTVRPTGFDVHGDVMAETHREFQFAVECKKDESWEGLEGLYKNARYPIWRWWQQAVDQAASPKRIPLLIFTRNHQPDYVACTVDTWNARDMDDDCVLTIARPVVIGLLDDFIATPWTAGRTTAGKLARGAQQWHHR